MPWIVLLVCLLFASGGETQEWTIERDADPTDRTSIIKCLPRVFTRIFGNKQKQQNNVLYQE